MGKKQCRCGKEHAFHIDVRSHTHIAMDRKLTPQQEQALRKHVQTKANDAAYEWLCMTQPNAQQAADQLIEKRWWKFW